jgi:hypothetical protein
MATYSTRIARPRWQSQVTDSQSRKAGEEENTKGSCKEADALQPPVRGHRLYIPCSELNETSQIRKCHNTPRWQAENVRPSCSVYSSLLLSHVFLWVLERFLPI